MLTKNHSRALAVVALALGCGAGCAAPKRTYQPDQDHNELNEIEFIHYLSPLPTVSMDEAYHAMLLLLGEENSAKTFEEREAILLDRKVTRRSWGLDADDMLDKGTLAYMIVEVCEVPGWVNDVMLGSWGPGDRRFALRRAVWHEMMPYGLHYQAVTGGELLATITRVAEHMEDMGLDGAS